MKTTLLSLLILAFVAGSRGWAGTIDDVKLLPRIEAYETIVNTTLVTQEGKKIPLDRGIRVNVAGFTATEAFVISRTDKPNGFIRKADLAPLRGSRAVAPPRIKEETIR